MPTATNRPLHVLILQPPAENEQDALTRFFEGQQESYVCSKAASVADIFTEPALVEQDLIILDFSLWTENAVDIQQAVTDVPVLLIADQGDEQMVADSAHQSITEVLFRDQNNNFCYLLPLVIHKIIEHRQLREERDSLRLRLANLENEQPRTSGNLNKHQRTEKVFRRLTDGVAHDLSNMLSPIIGFSKMLLNESGKDDPNLDLIEEIIDSAIRAQAMVRQLSIFREKEAKEFVRIDFAELLENFRKTLERTMDENTRIKISTGASLPLIKGDIALLEQAIMNLFLHLQETIEESGTINLSVQHCKADKNASDTRETGPGMFLRLNASISGQNSLRLDSSFSGIKDGSKDGLALVAAIVREHGGHIFVDEATSQGLDIYLPALDETIISPSPEAIANQSSECCEIILVLDRDKQLQQLISVVLREKGYTVFEADHEEAAAKFLEDQSQRIDLLLIDLTVFDSKSQLIHQLHTWNERPLKILCLASKEQAEIKSEIAVQFMQKPFALNTLADKVRSILDEGQ